MHPEKATNNRKQDAAPKKEQRKKLRGKKEAIRQSSLKDASCVGRAPFPGVSLFIFFFCVFFLPNAVLCGETLFVVSCGHRSTRAPFSFFFPLCACTRRHTNTRKKVTTKGAEQEDGQILPTHTRACHAHTKKQSR
nr:hypothetical protein [Pandoravirus aubagnensis]